MALMETVAENLTAEEAVSVLVKNPGSRVYKNEKGYSIEKVNSHFELKKMQSSLIKAREEVFKKALIVFAVSILRSKKSINMHAVKNLQRFANKEIPKTIEGCKKEMIYLERYVRDYTEKIPLISGLRGAINRKQRAWQKELDEKE